MSVAKLTIVILMLAALLFAVAPNLSWGSCTRPTRESGIPTCRLGICPAASCGTNRSSCSPYKQ